MEENEPIERMLTARELMELCKKHFNFSSNHVFYTFFRHKFTLKAYGEARKRTNDGKRIVRVLRIPESEALKTIQTLKKNPAWEESQR